MRKCWKGEVKTTIVRKQKFLGIKKKQASEEKHIRDLPIDTCQLEGRKNEISEKVRSEILALISSKKYNLHEFIDVNY